jgi:hypothetical protein
VAENWRKRVFMFSLYALHHTSLSKIKSVFITEKPLAFGGLPFFFCGVDATKDFLGTPLGQPLRPLGLGTSSAFWDLLSCLSACSLFSFPL